MKHQSFSTRPPESFYEVSQAQHSVILAPKFLHFLFDHKMDRNRRAVEEINSTKYTEKEKHTAIHEAGHCVVAIRVGHEIDEVSIDETEDSYGHVRGDVPVALAEDPEEARKLVLQNLGGYAALVAHGYPENEARDGANDDFASAEDLIKSWDLNAIDYWQSKAVAKMRKPENVAAVSRVAHEVLQAKTLKGELAQFLVMVVDGTMTEEELEALRMRMQ